MSQDADELPVATCFEGDGPGASLLVLGAVHGDETCGAEAVGELARTLGRGARRVARGRLTLVPITNPRAHRLGRRYVEENLNRAMREHPAPRTYEQRVANVIAPLIGAHDLLLDLHSFSSAGEPFAFQDYAGEPERALAEAIGVSPILVGWPEIYAGDVDIPDDSTQACAHRHGTVATTVECGSHRDPRAVAVARRCIERALAFAGVVDAKVDPAPAPRRVRMTEVVVKARAGRLERAWRHMDPAAAGTPIARYDDGEVLRAPADGYVVMPVDGAETGAEWFYFAVDDPDA